MEYEGVGVDVDFLRSYSKDLERDIDKAEQAVYKDAEPKLQPRLPEAIRRSACLTFLR